MALNVNPDFETDWFVFQRIQELKAAGRINWIRIVAITTFFTVAVVTSQGAAEGSDYLWRSFRLCFVWLLLAASIGGGLRVKVFPPIFAYITTTCDILLLTAVASMSGRANSQLVLGYFVIVAASYLRYRFRLVLFTFLLATFGYLTLVYNTPEFRVRAEGVPFPYTGVLRVIAGLAMMTLIGGQLCYGCREGLRLSIDTNLVETHQ